MFSFYWKSGYLVGVPVLDEQHQEMMRMLNELHETMMAGNPNDAAAPLIHQLMQLSKDHFAAEEELMRAAGFPGYAAHCAQHQALIEKVKEYLDRYRQGDKSIYGPFMYYLRDWLTRHMIEDDRAYVPWLAPPPAPPANPG